MLDMAQHEAFNDLADMLFPYYDWLHKLNKSEVHALDRVMKEHLLIALVRWFEKHGEDLPRG